MTLGKIPSEPHFAIITETSVHIPGDERSRTHPGHGYPAHTETYINYQAFTDRAEWEFHIQRLTERRTPFKAIAATPALIKTNVTVEVKP
ncbi:hypothetical protein AB4037_23260 [Labrys sp. KB_33_2]|uniref:hypothetical protein n=1 Tax=Labrys sp. KB_33_2 TaxID=3237479 RepID=UPI003F8ED6C0